MPIKPEDVKRAVSNSDDFGFEMRVGEILRKTVAKPGPELCPAYLETPNHGGTYTDAITSKPRQFDFRSRIIRNAPSYTAAGVFLAVECKNLFESSPLVICGRERDESESHHDFIDSWIYEPSGICSYVIKRSDRSDIYRPGEFVGKSLLRLKEKSGVWESDTTSSDIYDRWSQALSSSIDLAAEATQFATTAFSKKGHALILPVVVVPDRCLWKVAYNHAGIIAEDPAETDECQFFIERKIDVSGGELILTHIHFVTISGLSRLLDYFLGLSRTWDRMFPPFASEVRPSK